MKKYQSDYQNIVNAAFNKKTKNISLYEHNISIEVIEKIINKKISELCDGDFNDKKEYFSIISEFHNNYGYDTYSFEGCICSCIQGGKGLNGQSPGIIKNINDIDNYNWDELYDCYINRFDDYFRAISETLPKGMKIVGGIGNGIFESTQDFIPLTELAYLQIDQPEAYAKIWERVGDVVLKLWDWLLQKYSDIFAVCRFGDDLGFKSATLINPLDIKNHIFPQYKKIVERIHSFNKPFLLHSCGAIWNVMNGLIDNVKIDAKHSNEDDIAPFNVWLEKYGNRIGNFGGIDMNVVVLKSPLEIKEYVKNVYHYSKGYKGIAIGTGNQISPYVPPENFIGLTEAVRECWI